MTGQHVLVPLVTYQGGNTEYRCQKCNKTGLGGVRGTCNVRTGTERSDGDDDLRTDGGVTRQRRRLRRRDAESARTLAGAGDQGLCPNGNRECSRGADGDLPCFECLSGGDSDE